MRFSAVSIALVAGLAAAAPQQSVRPITQISDGQIQAPPATSVAVPTVSPSVPAVSTPVVSVPVVSAPVGTVSMPHPTATVVASVVPSSVAVIASSASPVASTSAAPSRASSATPSAASSSGVPQQSTAAAADTAISFGGLVFAVAAAVFA